MKWMRIFGPRPQDAEIDEEIRAHLEMAIQERIDRGESPGEARRAARLELGNVGAVKEDTRSVWAWRTLETFAQDLKYAVRRLRRSPGFTVVAVLTLALGLSVNATIFGLISSMFLRPLPVKNADRLVVVLQQYPNSDLRAGMAWSDYRDYRAQIREFADVLALGFRPANLSMEGRTSDRTWIEAVSGNYFSMLGVSPLAGRFFLPGEVETANADPIAILGYDYWNTRLGGDLGIIGQPIVVNGRPLTVVGIAPREFSSAQWAIAPSVFVPATMTPELFDDASILERRDSGAFKVVALLKPGVSAAQASNAVGALGQRLTREHRPDSEAQVSVQPERLTRPEPSVSRYVPFAAAVFAVLAGLVLFISCANVANLMFARATARRNEISTRCAIGAGRGRLVRQLLTESVVLAVLSGVLGLLLSHVAGIVLTGLTASTGDIPIRPDERWDWLPMIGTMLIAIVAGVATGLFPALRATKGNLLSIMKGGATGVGRERHVFRSGLVLGQIAMSVTVLACGGLFVRSLIQLGASDIGFRTDRLVMASVDLDLQGYDEERALRLLEQLTERISALPDVESAAIGARVPFDNFMSTRNIALAESPGGRDDDKLQAGVNMVDPSYFDTLGVTLVSGRAISTRDDVSSPRVAVINETLAARLWPGEDAVGRSFRWLTGEEPVEVIGVARNGRYFLLGESPRAFVYLPIAQEYSGMVTIHARTKTADALAPAPAMREIIKDLDRDLPVFNLRTMEEHLRSSAFAFLPLRVGSVLAGAQGLVALFLAVLGVYGVVASSIGQRTRDIGIRIAMGARKIDIFRLVARSGLRPATIGLALGLAASAGLAKLLKALLYGLDPVSIPMFIGIFALVFGTMLFACWLPTRRVLKLDPLSALRQE